MKTEYKGFNIEFVSNGITIDSGRYFVRADGFKAEGYSTLNNAKGAITKHLAAKGINPTGDFTKTEERIAELVEATRASGLTILHPSKPVVQSRNKREGRYAGKYGTHRRVPAVYNSRRNKAKIPTSIAAMIVTIAL